ncbi:sensor histidine kinase [Thermodesulforhabdus norvegica]|uniref:histidine kinase n=1 Tax=Thermodesulforhabdus norvegica TaxID=39841 RepID=A0A1I4SIT3_9BACT|nr:ATP-binding protein [Thermodesulforhabdus norvegica]SFM64230.1 His Kinase A (phospho-acceptor) domain-containing protein [Thermodesulforhabdus norvegica]
MKFDLRTRILGLLILTVAISCSGAVFTLWFTHQAKRLDLQGAAVTESLLTLEHLMESLIMQKGYLTYYFLSEDPSWLEMLRNYEEAFQKELKDLRVLLVGMNNSVDETNLGVLEDLSRLESMYVRYSSRRDQVLNLYRTGKREEGMALHWQVRKEFHEILAHAKKIQDRLEDRLTDARNLQNARFRTLTTLAWGALPASIIIAILLTVVLFRNLLGPLRRLAYEDTNIEANITGSEEIQALHKKLTSLMDSVTEVSSKLEESREHLAQSEKMALVGRLAAGVAHSIRNPLTSVKMRLFALERSLKLTPTQKEDFEVISEEIRHIDTIVRNFLEFARPPRLTMQKISFSDITDGTLQLLHHRLESYGVSVTVHRTAPLPETQLDPDRLKEALVNIILNACEAMVDGGNLDIFEEVGTMEPYGQVILVKIRDTGPGIPQEIQHRIFEPFFSTKDEGSGLGLSIAKRVVEDHGGWIHVHSSPGHGATFVIGIPLGERVAWPRL